MAKIIIILGSLNAMLAVILGVGRLSHWRTVSFLSLPGPDPDRRHCLASAGISLAEMVSLDHAGRHHPVFREPLSAGPDQRAMAGDNHTDWWDCFHRFLVITIDRCL